MLLIYLLIVITACIITNHIWVTSRLRGEQPCKAKQAKQAKRGARQ